MKIRFLPHRTSSQSPLANRAVGHPIRIEKEHTKKILSHISSLKALYQATQSPKTIAQPSPVRYHLSPPPANATIQHQSTQRVRSVVINQFWTNLIHCVLPHPAASPVFCLGIFLFSFRSFFKICSVFYFQSN